MPQTLLPVTFTYVSLLAISLMVFTAWIGILRGKLRILRGSGGDPILFKRIRIHGNLMETAPTFGLVMGAAEYTGLGAGWLWAGLATFLAGRVLHYVLFDHRARGAATFLTVGPGVLMGFWLLAQVWL
ncbi:MAPEG family protein [Pseudoroseicyclus sp. CXY001]|uniref:MAPEG family protein n=1 Tax=Pseudoroseicyclus sp. CXY001 TaxID=3242492 RepID=UPI0035714651